MDIDDPGAGVGDGEESSQFTPRPGTAGTAATTASISSNTTLRGSRKLTAGDVMLVPELTDGNNRINTVTVGLGWEAAKGVDLDVYLLCFDERGELLENVYFDNLESANGSIIHTGDNLTGEGEGDDEQVHVTLPHVADETFNMMVVVNSYSGETFSEVSSMYCRLVIEPGLNLSLSGVSEADGGESEGEGEGESEREGSGSGSDTYDEDGRRRDGSGVSSYEDGEGEGEGEGEGGETADSAAPAVVRTPRELELEAEICMYEILCEGDNTTMVLANIHRTPEGRWLMRTSNLRATGDTIDEMLIQLIQSMRDFIDGLPEYNPDPEPPRGEASALTTELAGQFLRDIGPTADGTGHVYKTIDVEHTAITDVSGLAAFKHLQHVYLRDSKITSVDVLNELDFLLTLDVSRNSLRSWDEVKSRAFLETADFSRNYIDAMTPVVHPSLRSISYQRCRLKGVSNLEKYTSLKILDIRGNRVPSLRRVSAPSLTTIYMAENGVRLIGKFVDMPNLTHLHLRDNKMAKLKGLDELTSLRYLNIRGNKVEEFDEVKRLSTLTNLTSLNIIDNEAALNAGSEYRIELLVLLPSLEIVDKDPIERGERLDALDLKEELEAAEREEAEEDFDRDGSVSTVSDYY